MYVDYNTYGYASDTSSSALGALGAVMGVMFLIFGVIMIFAIVCQWKLFKKAGKNGWEAIVPIYNMVVLFDIAKTPLWMIILFFIPIANIIVMFMLYINLAKQFGKDTGFGIGLAFLPLIFLPILAFGKTEYIGDSSFENNANNMNNNFSSNSQPINNNFQSVNQTMDYNNINNGINNNINDNMNNNFVNNNVNNDLGFIPQTNNEFVNNNINSIQSNNIGEETSVISPVNITNINETPNQVNEVSNQINDESNQINNNPIQFSNTNELSNQPIITDSQMAQPIIPENQVSTNEQPVQEKSTNNIGFSDLTNKIENVNLVNNENICPNCGTKYNNGDMFCISCGSKLN